jgi:hypothetical protein
MNTRLLAAVVLAIVPPLWAPGALAAQITFGPSAQSITFTGNGANSVTVVSQQLTGLALDTINGAVGTLSLSPLSFIAGPQSGGLFPAGSVRGGTLTMHLYGEQGRHRLLARATSRSYDYFRPDQKQLRTRHGADKARSRNGER